MHRRLCYAVLLSVPVLLLEAQHVSIVAAFVCGVWYAVTMPYIFRKLPEVPARRLSMEAQGRSHLMVAFHDIRQEVKELRKCVHCRDHLPP
jgi:hypothetical protein